MADFCIREGECHGKGASLSFDTLYRYLSSMGGNNLLHRGDKDDGRLLVTWVFTNDLQESLCNP